MMSFNKVLQFLLHGLVPQKSFLGALATMYGMYSAGEAADEAAAGASAGQKITKEQYEQGRADLEPYREAGTYGLEKYVRGVNRGYNTRWGGFDEMDMYADPGYQFRRDQGLEALDRMSSKAGQRFSGARGYGLMDLGQRMASQEFGAARGRSLQDYQLRRGEETERFGQWAGLAQMGQQAAGSMSSLGQQYAGSMSNLYGQQSQAQAAGTMGMSNAFQGGLAGYQYQQNFDRYMGGGLGSYGGGGASYYNQPVPTAAMQAGDAYMPTYQPQR